MTTPTQEPDRRLSYPDDAADNTAHVHEHLAQEGKGAHRGHGLMMLVCCIPMIAIAVLLVTTRSRGLGRPAVGAGLHGHDGRDDARDARRPQAQLTGFGNSPGWPATTGTPGRGSANERHDP